jgi:hypothetical protein
MCSSFLAFVDVKEFHTVDTYLSLCLTSVKCNINKLSRVEEELVKVHIKPSILTVWEKVWSVYVEMQFDQVVSQGL